MADKTYNAIMVSETHWDRAWYVPFETFRMRLVRLVDQVILILDSDPDFKSFMLDGQMLPVEDYLEIRPERRSDLERLVRSGKLQVGPWYSLADEYLVSPEALIRNLIIGIRMAQELGGVMREGYVPDAFGHINQLPQFLQGFGISSAVFWRGVGDEGEQLGNEFWWRAPDGTKVLAVHLPDGYHNAANLGYPMRWGDISAMEFNMDLALQQLRDAVTLLRPRAPTPNLLLMNGIDHAELEPRVPAIIERANRELLAEGLHIEHGTLPEYIARVRRAVERPLQSSDELPTFEGEFNRGRYAVILQGVYSTRMYIKQANERVQTLLERYAEPLAAWAWSLRMQDPLQRVEHPLQSDGEYPQAFLDHAWRRLLQNHCHDDICGCSMDAVHRENMVRYGDAQQVAAAVARDSFRSVVSHIDRTAQPGVPFVLFNPLAWPYTGTAELSLLFDKEDARAENFGLVDAAGRPVPVQPLSRSEHFEMEVLKGSRKREVRAAVKVDSLPPCGYRVYYAVSPSAELPLQTAVAAVSLLPNGMENRHLRVEINPDGSLDVLDKTMGRQFRNLGYFEDTEDAGDEYDYSPARHSETVTSPGGTSSAEGRTARARLVHVGPLQATWEISLNLPLPSSLTKDRQRRRRTRVNCPIKTRVTLRYEGRAVELQTAVDNRARDHRLRVCFPSDVSTDQSAAGGHFDVISRPIDLPLAGTTGWAQPPVPTRHQRGFVDVSDGEAGLAVLSRGLPEYEVLRDGHNTIAVTLLRCVDAISRGDMLSRPGDAGVPCPAPEGQCQGRHVFEYAIYPHGGDWQAVYREATVFQAPLYLRRGDETEGYLPKEVWPQETANAPKGSFTLKTPALGGELPAELSLLSLRPETLVLSAVKRSESKIPVRKRSGSRSGGDNPLAETSHALIVRFYNPAPEPVEATLRTFRPIRFAQTVNLNEEPQAELAVAEENAVVLPIAAKQVRTVALQF